MGLVEGTIGASRFSRPKRSGVGSTRAAAPQEQMLKENRLKLTLKCPRKYLLFQETPDARSDRRFPSSGRLRPAALESRDGKSSTLAENSG